METKESNTLDQSPVVQSIIGGKSKITHVGEEGGFIQRRTINGKEWSGTSYEYKVELPNPLDSSKKIREYIT